MAPWGLACQNVCETKLLNIKSGRRPKVLNVLKKAKGWNFCFGDRSWSTMKLLYRPKCSQKAKPEHFQNQSWKKCWTFSKSQKAERSCKGKGKEWIERSQKGKRVNLHAKAMARTERSFKGKGRRLKAEGQNCCFGDGSLSTMRLLYRPECSQKAKPEHSQNQKMFQKVPIKLQKARMCLGHFYVPSTPWNAPTNWVSGTLTRVWTWNWMTRKDNGSIFCT